MFDTGYLWAPPDICGVRPHSYVLVYNMPQVHWSDGGHEPALEIVSAGCPRWNSVSRDVRDSKANQIRPVSKEVNLTIQPISNNGDRVRATSSHLHHTNPSFSPLRPSSSPQKTRSLHNVGHITDIGLDGPERCVEPSATLRRR